MTRQISRPIAAVLIIAGLGLMALTITLVGA